MDDDRPDSMRPLARRLVVALLVMLVLIGLGYVLVTFGS
jgi:Tfp pilus assembly protein PilO